MRSIKSHAFTLHTILLHITYFEEGFKPLTALNNPGCECPQQGWQSVTRTPSVSRKSRCPLYYILISYWWPMSTSLGQGLPKSQKFTANHRHLLIACAAGQRDWKTVWETAGRADRLVKSVRKKKNILRYFFSISFYGLNLSTCIICVIQYISVIGSRIWSHAPR